MPGIVSGGVNRFGPCSFRCCSTCADDNPRELSMLKCSRSFSTDHVCSTMGISLRKSSLREDFLDFEVSDIVKCSSM